jgi:hypothetical protein
MQQSVTTLPRDLSRQSDLHRPRLPVHLAHQAPPVPPVAHQTQLVLELLLKHQAPELLLTYGI